jgi:hypothetical protein
MKHGGVDLDPLAVTGRLTKSFPDARALQEGRKLRLNKQGAIRVRETISAEEHRLTWR